MRPEAWWPPLRYGALRRFWALPYDTRRALLAVCLPPAYRHLQRRRTQAVTSFFSFRTFDRWRCLYIHIPKTAGISIGTSLFGHPTGHRRLEVYQLAYSRVEFESYFKFAFVRNPWDRLVSSYFFLKDGGLTTQDKRWAASHLAGYPDFESFVRGWVNRANVETYVHFIPQFRFICEPGSAVPRLDFIGRFENLAHDLARVQARLGMTCSLPHLNPTGSRQRDYRPYYSDRTRKIVADAYQTDIRLFGYDFDNGSLAARWL